MTRKIRLKSALAVTLIPVGILIATGTIAQAQTTNCTSYVLGNIITTDCYGSPPPRQGFNRYPALEVEVPDFAGAIRKGQREAEAIRTQRLQNQLLEQQLQQQQWQAQQQQIQQQQLRQLQQQIQELRSQKIPPAPQPRAVPTDAEQRSIVASVQQVLTSLGYDPGPNDGIAGPRTRAAIRAFQADHDIAVTGETSVSLEFALYEQRLRQQQ